MPTTKYRQIADDLRDKIKSREIPPGSQLQTENELQERYKASRNTVRDALKFLTTLGLVQSRPGQGTFVADKIEPFVTVLTADSRAPGGGGVEVPGDGTDDEQTKKVPVKELLDVSFEIPSDRVATMLELDKDCDVVRRREARSIGAIPWSLQTSYYPSTFVEKGANLLTKPRDIEAGTVDYLAKVLDLRESSYSDLITVRNPDDDEAQLFKLPEDGRVGVFEIFRTAFDQHGKPMRLTITVCPTDRNQFAVFADTPDPQATDQDQRG